MSEIQTKIGKEPGSLLTTTPFWYALLLFYPNINQPEYSNTLQDDAWFGFGYGPRACPAVRWAYVAMKIFLVQVLRNYRIVKSNRTLDYNQWEMQLVGLSLRPSKPLLVKFEKR